MRNEPTPIEVLITTVAWVILAAGVIWIMWSCGGIWTSGSSLFLK